MLTTPDSGADILVAVEGPTPSILAALDRPARHLPRGRFGVLDRKPRRELVGDDARIHQVSSPSELLRHLPRLGIGLTIGAHLPVGALAHEALDVAGGVGIVVQHGVMTPFAPPLPEGTHLLAFSEADGHFWCGARDDASFEVVGSQMLWEAAQRPVHGVPADATPIFLGQLHAAEFERRELADASFRFCRATGARYRPHPAETDRISRGYHALWRRRGVAFATSQKPLPELAAPVVAVFSGGLVEAAAAGIPSWGHHPDPPPWLTEFWDRYGIARWGHEPSAAPDLPAVEPARRIAELVGSFDPSASS